MSSLKQNSLKSLGYLFFQSGYSAVLGLITNLIITALAAKQVFGIYATTLATIAIFNYLSDIGLAGALIQKKEVTEDDLSTVFTVQQSIITTLVICGLLLTPFVQSYYHLPKDAIYLYWAVLAGFFISSLKTIPSVLLERSVKFANIVRVQVVENTLFYVIVSGCMLAGLNLYSFAIGVIVRSLAGTILMYRASPWRPRLKLHIASLKELLSFGVPFQANSLLALVKDELMIIFLGRTLGMQGLGDIVWAKKWAEAPIRIIMDNVSKILFPVLSRMQDDKDKLQKTVSVTIWLQTIILAPTLLLAAVALPYLVNHLPQYHKWQNALPIFYIFCASAFFSTLSTPFMNIFNALKKPKVPLYFMIFWTASTWLLTPWFISRFGPIGFAWVQLILSCTFVAVVYYSNRLLKLRLFAWKEVYTNLKELILPIVLRLHRGKVLLSEIPVSQSHEDKLE